MTQMGELSMTTAAKEAIHSRARRVRNLTARSQSGPHSFAKTLFVLPLKKSNTSVKEWRRVFNHLVDRVMASPGITLFDAVEAGVPTYLVNVIAGATGEPVTTIMELVGVPETTFRRKEDAKEPLPDAAGYRVMGFLRVVATLRKLLTESGDPEQLKSFDLEGWVAQWMREKLPELGDKTPAQMLRNPEGQRAVEEVLERMRGGLAA